MLINRQHELFRWKRLRDLKIPEGHSFRIFDLISQAICTIAALIEIINQSYRHKKLVKRVMTLLGFAGLLYGISFAAVIGVQLFMSFPLDDPVAVWQPTLLFPLPVDFLGAGGLMIFTSASTLISTSRKTHRGLKSGTPLHLY
jgi:hypothetical protein